MTNYIITNPNSKYGYDFVRLDDNGNVLEQKEITSKTTDGYLHLPVAINGRKLISLKQLADCEKFDLDTLQERAPRTTSTTSTAKKVTFDWTKYLTEDEKKIVDEIKAKCEERAQKDIKQAKIDAMKAEIAKLMKEIEG